MGAYLSSTPNSDNSKTDFDPSKLSQDHLYLTPDTPIEKFQNPNLTMIYVDKKYMEKVPDFIYPNLESYDTTKWDKKIADYHFCHTLTSPNNFLNPTDCFKYHVSSKFEALSELYLTPDTPAEELKHNRKIYIHKKFMTEKETRLSIELAKIAHKIKFAHDVNPWFEKISQFYKCASIEEPGSKRPFVGYYTFTVENK